MASSDILDIDPQVLEDTAIIIEGYCNKQKSIMEEYLSNISALSADWTDDKTLGPLLEEIKALKNSTTSVMDEIMSKYPAYFRQKAELIKSRPTI